METLIEKLYNNNVIFSYYGFIDRSVLEQVLMITRSKLESGNECEKVVKQVSETLSDCIDNIISHNFYPDDERLHYKSLLVVSKHNDDYHIDALNVVNETQKHVIDEQLGFLNSKSRAELQALLSGKSGGGNAPVSSRLIAMVLKADRYNCSYKKVGANYLFNINFQISSRQLAGTNS